MRPGALLLALLLAPSAAAARPPVVPGGPIRLGSPAQQFKTRFQGRPAPDFTLADLQGRTVRLSSLRGQVVLLNFWYSSCTPCRREIPDLITLHRLYQGRGLRIIGMNLDGILMPEAGRAPLQAFLKEFPVPYPVVPADAGTFEAYGSIPVQPISFLVDRDGVIARVLWGAFPGAMLEKAIEPLLQRAAAPR